VDDEILRAVVDDAGRVAFARHASGNVHDERIGIALAVVELIASSAAYAAPALNARPAAKQPACILSKFMSVLSMHAQRLFCS
jgi:hypothetical protein